MNEKADIGFIGLGVMGQNLVLNMNDHGFRVAVYNRTKSKLDDFMHGNAKGTKVVPADSIKEMMSLLKSPKIVMLMVKAGKPVDIVINYCVQHLSPGDIIINGGNSHYEDSMRLTEEMKEKGLLYVGCGVSGGEEGARKGPSMMPGGSKEAWVHIKTICQGIAAKVSDGTPCCDWVGDSGAGHLVKMVHNGIEYGDMQLISEAYDIMNTLLDMKPDEMSDIFSEWNKDSLNSFLIEITSNILSKRDDDGEPMVDKILDTAGQKGTGKWTSVSSLDTGVPLTLIGEAVFTRFLSALKDERINASKILTGPVASFDGDKQSFLNDIKEALYASKIVSYAQGYMLIKTLSDKYDWHLDYGAIALMWREGCIIRAAFLDKIQEAFAKNPELTNLLLDPYFKEVMQSAQSAWRRVVCKATEFGIPLPAISSALVFYDGYRRERLPCNLLQAQRDYFGAHTYERIDRPRGEFFHTDWTGQGGDITSGSYNA